MNRKKFLYIFLILLSVSCHRSEIREASEEDCFPPIFPDLNEVTIPPNVAPLNFLVEGGYEQLKVELTGNNGRFTQYFKGNKTRLDPSKWQELLHNNSGQSIFIRVFAKEQKGWKKFRPFTISVAREPVDDYLVYRLIMPGFQTWNNMGIYQRQMSSFKQETIADSRLLPGTCMNCHTFLQNAPDNMVLHLRENNSGTVLRQNQQLRKINTKSEGTFSAAGFPYWHPSGKFVAFSINKVKQVFHSTGPVRAHAIDMNSDMAIYDVEQNEMFSSDVLMSEQAFEAFPCFSPDGGTLYFVSSKSGSLPEDQHEMKYSLCAVSFDAQTKKIGAEVDTLISAAVTGKSVSIPRISPDGRFLMVCLFDYGNFPSYNPESDLYLLDLHTKAFYPLELLNSPDVESYHSWSSNGRWVVFSSRRMDGLYSHIYIGYIDSDGQPRKPFLLPQKDAAFYSTFLYSFNLPEFVVRRVDISAIDFERTAKESSAEQLRFDNSH